MPRLGTPLRGLTPLCRLLQGVCYAKKCKDAGDILLHVRDPNTEFPRSEVVCVPAAALGCARGSPVADFAGCSACPAKQCLARLALSDPKLRTVKALLKWRSSPYAWFDTAPVTCSAICAGCATLGTWSGEGAARAERALPLPLPLLLPLPLPLLLLLPLPLPLLLLLLLLLLLVLLRINLLPAPRFHSSPPSA